MKICMNSVFARIFLLCLGLALNDLADIYIFRPGVFSIRDLLKSQHPHISLKLLKSVGVDVQINVKVIFQQLS